MNNKMARTTYLSIIILFYFCFVFKKNFIVFFRYHLTPYAQIITLNVNGLNAPITRHRVAEWRRRPMYVLPTRDPL